MDIEIITQPLELTIYGYSGVALNRDYAGTAFQLMDRMWRTIRENDIKHKGLNTWVYESDHRVFAGVELMEEQKKDSGLESKHLTLSKYASYKHIGSYKLIKQAGLKMTEELKRKGYTTQLPYVEIYGHWTNEAARLETELLMSLQ